jgi:hypothetical protein
MLATTNNGIRQKLLVDLVTSLSSEDLYLCFSYDPYLDLGEDLSDVDVDSIHDGVDISLVYAVKLDDILKYAIQYSKYAGDNSVSFNGIQYSIEDSLTGLEDYYFTNLYFNVVINPSSEFDYNMVSVVYGMSGVTPDGGGVVTDFSAVDLASAVLLVQTRHADTTINSETEFPGLIVF